MTRAWIPPALVLLCGGLAAAARAADGGSAGADPAWVRDRLAR
ncbi:hypothetical protein [Streptomyces narbonensis]